MSNQLDVDFHKASYLRPDSAGSLLPWIYTIIIIILHVPMVLIRVARWESVQYLCLVSTLFTIIIYIQAFISTKFDAAKVLVWSPLILVIDAGSMLQVFFLIIEAKKEARKEAQEKAKSESLEAQIEGGPQCSSPYASSGTMELQDLNGLPVEGEEQEPDLADSQRPSNLLALNSALKVPTAVAERPLIDKRQHDQAQPMIVLDDDLPFPDAVVSTYRESCWYRDPANYAMVIAALLFVTVLVLQLLGLAKAAQAAGASSDPPPVSWCSPLFQPFGIAAIDGSCNVYQVSQSAHRGIGCIKIPGHWQQQWLKGTVAGISIELVTELIDLLILSLVNGGRKVFEHVKMKRPWATMFSGVIVLIITLIYGFNYSQYLPPGVTEKVMVLMNVDGPASYMGKLAGAGLRGTIIGWNDGLFESWKATYFGSWWP